MSTEGLFSVRDVGLWAVSVSQCHCVCAPNYTGATISVCATINTQMTVRQRFLSLVSQLCEHCQWALGSGHAR